MRISDWSSDVCSSDLEGAVAQRRTGHIAITVDARSGPAGGVETGDRCTGQRDDLPVDAGPQPTEGEPGEAAARCLAGPPGRREAEPGLDGGPGTFEGPDPDRKSTRLNSRHLFAT